VCVFGHFRRASIHLSAHGPPGPMDRRALGIRYDHALRAQAGGGERNPQRPSQTPKRLALGRSAGPQGGAQLGSGSWVFSVFGFCSTALCRCASGGEGGGERGGVGNPKKPLLNPKALCFRPNAGPQGRPAAFARLHRFVP
jgi:hypothetical protein